MLVFELDSLIKEGNDREFRTKAEKLHNAVLQHIDEEESTALPRLQEKADPGHAEQLTDAVRTFRKSLHFEMTSA